MWTSAAPLVCRREGPSRRKAPHPGSSTHHQILCSQWMPHTPFASSMCPHAGSIEYVNGGIWRHALYVFYKSPSVGGRLLLSTHHPPSHSSSILHFSIATGPDMQFKAPLGAVILTTLAIIPNAHAGPLAYGICQSGCNALAVTCYAAAGAVFGTVTAGVGTPAAILACNAALGTCATACVAAGFAPTL
ncbi:hypothetical protein C8Q78DRAFT_1058448 [Trametes maxima]|nr:hypothetical protein C8Q78DRAFT_1058448 [Trametes maxima]